ncbi:protease inhibitor I42 family protein [Desulfovibrio aminophilus]|uniref:protease inhibitor I42 family protein n=1 Tax=Desulfovibrio aminophilus TaxID=81425 RepID=UPI000485FA92|nr:protease inhibitor I42 family protein [Desulfovibrio aminophilus]
MGPARLASILLILLFLSGCGLFSGGSGGATRHLDLDGEGVPATALLPGETLLLEMRHPGDGGYQFSGASFDPAVLRLDKFWTEPPSDPKPGDFGRAYFVFTALKEGSTTVEIRIRRPWEKNSAPEIYRSVSVSAGAAESPAAEPSAAKSNS